MPNVDYTHIKASVTRVLVHGQKRTEDRTQGSSQPLWAVGGRAISWDREQSGRKNAKVMASWELREVILKGRVDIGDRCCNRITCDWEITIIGLRNDILCHEVLLEIRFHWVEKGISGEEMEIAIETDSALGGSLTCIQCLVGFRYSYLRHIWQIWLFHLTSFGQKSIFLLPGVIFAFVSV